MGTAVQTVRMHVCTAAEQIHAILRQLKLEAATRIAQIPTLPVQESIRGFIISPNCDGNNWVIMPKTRLKVQRVE